MEKYYLQNRWKLQGKVVRHMGHKPFSSNSSPGKMKSLATQREQNVASSSDLGVAFKRAASTPKTPAPARRLHTYCSIPNSSQTKSPISLSVTSPPSLFPRSLPVRAGKELLKDSTKDRCCPCRPCRTPQRRTEIFYCARRCFLRGRRSLNFWSAPPSGT